MNYHINKLTIKYTVYKQEVCEQLDKKIEKAANEQGLELIGSGFDFLKQERDLAFESPSEQFKKSMPEELKV